MRLIPVIAILGLVLAVILSSAAKAVLAHVVQPRNTSNSSSATELS